MGNELLIGEGLQFLFYLSLVFFSIKAIQYVITFFLNVVYDKKTPLKISNIERIFVLLSVAYIITYLL